MPGVMITRVITLSQPHRQFCGICGSYVDIVNYDSDMLLYVCSACLVVVIRAEVQLRSALMGVPEQDLIMENP
jgi:hypothetical protein